jgi:hypothetical protein
MRKVPTLFQRDPEDMRRVLPVVAPGCEWVLAGEGAATRKYDGTCVMLDHAGDWWARREVKPGKRPPSGFLAVESDSATGKTVGWEPIGQSSFAKFHAEAVRNDGGDFDSGTYELCGPKINGNPEAFAGHCLVPHWLAQPLEDVPLTFDGLAALLSDGFPYEGIVWHHADGRMAKLKRRDFKRGGS